jgi:hypothetical protein
VPGLGAVISTDAGGGGPAELMQAMLTMGDLTGGMAYLSPHAWDAPERAAAEIGRLKQDLERERRDRGRSASGCGSARCCTRTRR